MVDSPPHDPVGLLLLDTITSTRETSGEVQATTTKSGETPVNNILAAGGIHLAVTPTLQPLFCLSKAFLIGFEMDYPNQTVNLRHIASVDR
jgi:hypothetical protein